MTNLELKNSGQIYDPSDKEIMEMQSGCLKKHTCMAQVKRGQRHDAVSNCPEACMMHAYKAITKRLHGGIIAVKMSIGYL